MTKELSPLTKQIATEGYNVVYGAKLNFASLDICDKLPGIISFVSLGFGAAGLAFENVNTQSLALLLLLIGIAGLLLQPRESSKDQYAEAGKRLTAISKELETLLGALTSGAIDEKSVRSRLSELSKEANEVNQPQPVFLASWLAHVKVFSEYSHQWFSEPLKLSFIRDMMPMSFRLTLAAAFVAAIIYINPYCIASKAWDWVQSPCPEDCWQQVEDGDKIEQGQSGK